jgi:hypothetical protein
MNLCRLTLACTVVASLGWAGEQVVLRNGFRIAADRHELVGPVARLHTQGGVIEIPAASVASYEQEERVETLPPPRSPQVPGSPQSRLVPAAAPPQPAPPPPANAKQLIDQAADRYGVPAAFLHAVARAESAYKPDAVSHKGAIGVMQLMPATAAQLGADPRDPAQNIDAGARHLRDLLVQYNGSSHKALSAYNAGPGAVERHGGVPPYRETRNYVEKVIQTYQKLSALDHQQPEQQ